MFVLLLVYSDVTKSQSSFPPPLQTSPSQSARNGHNYSTGDGVALVRLFGLLAVIVVHQYWRLRARVIRINKHTHTQYAPTCTHARTHSHMAGTLYGLFSAQTWSNSWSMMCVDVRVNFGIVVVDV